MNSPHASDCPVTGGGSGAINSTVGTALQFGKDACRPRFFPSEAGISSYRGVLQVLRD